MGMRPGSLTVPFEDLEPPTAYMLKMLVPLALKETSDFKEAMPLWGVWRSAATMSGAHCVTTLGVKLMPWSLADSLGSQPLVPLQLLELLFLMVWDRSG
jgi:hypothetical protein